MSASEIEDSAARWIVLAQERGLPDERARLEEWLAADPRHRAAYLRLEAVWRKTGRLKTLRAMTGAIDKDLFKVGGKRGKRRKWAVAIAAGVLFAAVSTGVWVSLAAPRWQTHVTEPGGFARVTLKDGSTVDLNSDSEIRVRLTNARRDIMLVRGEGHFSVARDVSRPFAVAAGGQTVRALGTAFSVRLRAGRLIDVLVTEGRVAIGSAREKAPSISGPSVGRAGKEERSLKAGEVAIVDEGSVVVRQVEADEVSQRLAWAAGRLYFEGETLAEAVAQFNRYTERKLTIEDKELAGLRIGGNFRATDVEGFVGALADSFDVQAETTDPAAMRLIRKRTP